MIASVFELYGACCFLSLIAFLVLAARAKLRPDLEEDDFDIGELANPGQFVDTLPVEDPRSTASRRKPMKQLARPASTTISQRCSRSPAMPMKMSSFGWPTG